jgi:glycerol-3-phosphate dehydrogenase
MVLYDVLIIGCGVIGAAAAYELSKYRLSVAVLEKENDVSNGTSKANSAIIHAGYDPEPGTLMAQLNAQGSELAEDLCRKLDVPYLKTGSLVLAFSNEELSVIRELYERGLKNGVKRLELISSDTVRSIEPNVNPDVRGALLAPDAAIVSPWEYTLALAETAVKNRAELYLNSPVTDILALPEGGFRVFSQGNAFEARIVVNAAGVYADEVHNMAAPPEFSITPMRGEYWLLDKSEAACTDHVIFQCPGPLGKGVLVSPTVHGNLIVGPNTEQAAGKDDTATTGSGLEFVKKMAQRSIPSVDFRRNIRNFAGLRAVSDCDDFIIRESRHLKGFIDLAGIKSPGLSAAPAIARMCADIVGSIGPKLELKDTFIDRRTRVRFRELSPDDKNRLIRQIPAYGNVICRCETVTEGEILDALKSPIPPQSIDAVKRRTGSGLGRCQGGFCGPRILSILARETGLPPEEILLDKCGTFVLAGETKKGGRHV